MSYNSCASLFMYIYSNLGATPEQKIRRAHEIFHNMSDVWEEDLKIFCNYSEKQLPIIKGVEVKTKYQENVRDYTIITEYPEQVQPEVQKTIMRLLGEVGGYECEKWGIGQINKTINKHLVEYRNTHQGVKFIFGSDYGYPKVFTFDFNIVDEAPNESYSVIEWTGLMLG